MTEAELLEKIDLSDRTEPRLRESGMPIDALIVNHKVLGQDASALAEGYCLPVEQVEIAFEYYRRHPEVVDARITLNYAV